MDCLGLIYSDFYIGSAAQLSEANACGSGWNEKIIPDIICGVRLTPACKIHDFDYEFGREKADKIIADVDFLGNLLIIFLDIDRESFIILRNGLMRKLDDAYTVKEINVAWETFHNKVKIIVSKVKKNYFKKWFWYIMAMKYFQAVSICGDGYFWNNKEKE